jgi:hypothetical protein
VDSRHASCTKLVRGGTTLEAVVSEMDDAHEVNLSSSSSLMLFSSPQRTQLVRRRSLGGVGVSLARCRRCRRADGVVRHLSCP